ncbi:hypothetical protein [Rhizobium oryzicola]|uniref:Uncharacterized protein n=1 Tax=Rhizobium oryzicola TaxID=1232668 RepID=A0ABT8SWE3_9HYPH|nr:hypothetical protein [Rhizobium oryzicola]MDO1582203.1 hypothetical protein [Rhizobium oryzicola]
MALIFSMLSLPVWAQENRAELVDDFLAYSMFMVANRNCPGLTFNPDRLHQQVSEIGRHLYFTPNELRSRTTAIVQQSVEQFQADRGAFCVQALAVLGDQDTQKLLKAGMLTR